jgi:hypothetical protein
MERTALLYEQVPRRHFSVGDLLEDTADLNSAQVAELDQLLRAAHAYTLTEVRMQVWGKRIPQILRRGRIRTDNEYYLLKEAADGSGCGLSADEIDEARTIVEEYELGAGRDNA